MLLINYKFIKIRVVQKILIKLISVIIIIHYARQIIAYAKKLLYEQNEVSASFSLLMLRHLNCVLERPISQLVVYQKYKRYNKSNYIIKLSEPDIPLNCLNTFYFFKSFSCWPWYSKKINFYPIDHHQLNSHPRVAAG